MLLINFNALSMNPLSSLVLIIMYAVKCISFLFPFHDADRFDFQITSFLRAATSDWNIDAINSLTVNGMEVSVLRTVWTK